MVIDILDCQRRTGFIVRERRNRNDDRSAIVTSITLDHW